MYPDTEFSNSNYNRLFYNELEGRNSMGSSTIFSNSKTSPVNQGIGSNSYNNFTNLETVLVPNAFGNDQGLDRIKAIRFYNGTIPTITFQKQVLEDCSFSDKSKVKASETNSRNI